MTIMQCRILFPITVLMVSLIAIGPIAVVGWNIALNVTTQAGGAFGGSPFAVQPVITVNNKKGELQRSFEGRATVQIDSLPNGRYVHVWKKGDPMPPAAAQTFVSESVVDGQAIFKGLGIDTASQGYTLKFILYDEHDLVMGAVLGEEFTVEIGDAYQLSFVTQPETAYGGSVFGSQPILAIQDRGGNIVTDVNEGMVAVTRQSGPDGSALRCLDDDGFSIPLKRGLANFQGLYINEAGRNYALRFSTDVMLDGHAEVDSNEFTVGVGQAANIVLINDASVGSVFGGKPLAPQPRAEVRDAGGNILVDDSSSAIRVSIYNNPSRGQLSPVSATIGILQKGVVQFRSLSIDKAGIGYRLKYDLLQHKEEQLEESSIFTIGSHFNVEIGPPHQLSFLRHSSGGWADNQPFPTQPKLALMDAGGNIVVGDSSSMVAAHVTPSISHNSILIIDTSNDAIPSVTEVRFSPSIKNDDRALYGPGDVIDIDVIFSQKVTLFQVNEDGALPLLVLNINSADPGAVHGELVLPHREGAFWRTLTFRYKVKAGHLQTEVNYLTNNSLYGNGYSIEDAFGRNANLNLPATGSSASLSASKSIGVSDAQPTIERVEVDLPTGEYGSGDEVNFILTFDREVVVTGIPKLPLNVRSPRAAIFVDGSGTTSLKFLFKVLPGDDVERLNVSESTGAELLFAPGDSIALLTNAPGASPISVDPNIEGLSIDQHIVIDTAPPYVTSITPQASTTNGTYTVGDRLFFEVSFDKAVVVDIGLELALNADGGVARYISGSGTRTLVMQYTVKEGDVASKLDYRDSKALVSHNTEGGRSPVIGHVRRKSLFPVTDANLDISRIPSMADAHSIVIDGTRPRLSGVSFTKSQEGQIFGRGDIVTILVHFSAPVVVKQSDPPIFGLFVGANERWATYSSGSRSANLSFDYQVVVGDASVSPELKFRKFCNQSRDCSNTKGLIVRLSETLELDADLITGFSWHHGIQIAASPETGVTIDTSTAPPTTVVSTTTQKPAGIYGVGEIVDILVRFTDRVFFIGTIPTLLLNTGSFAIYYAGNETDTMTFRYNSKESDTTSKLDWALDQATNSAIACTHTCKIENANRIGVDLRFYDSDSDSLLIEQLDSTVAFDPTPPRIVSAVSDKTKSHYCHPECAYTVGEEINVYVTFDRPVTVQGTDVFLLMDVGNNVRAEFVPSKSSENELAFIYIVGQGHSSDGASLNYICLDTLCSLQLGEATEIKGAASIPTVDADLTLPPRPEQLIPILISTSGHPSVIDVFSNSPDGDFSPGDTIEIYVLFSRTIAVSGEPFLTLNVGANQSGIATYKGNYTNRILFEYTVGLNHTALDLDYIDAHSLHLGLVNGVIPGSIKQASTNPSIDANLDLAFPGSAGSLGSNSDIKIDSRTPFITLVSAVSGEFSTGDKISIQIEFSRPVALFGSPLLLLRVGNSDRIADYDSQPNDTTIEFLYTVELGDSTDSLNYWSNEELLPSSRMSLSLNGGWIKLKSASPSLDADLHINPIDGFLDGDKVVQVTEGIALFRDLKIGQRGKDFKIWFQSTVPSTGGSLQVAETVEIEASIEYQVQGDLTNRDPGDLYGSAVSLSGDRLAVGAPGKLNPTPEVQVLTVYSEAAVEEQEVQIIVTSVNRGEAVKSSQEFRSCANAGESIKGIFTLTYIINGSYAFASPLEFESDVTSDHLKSTLEQNLNFVQSIEASRSINPYCESQNSWIWTITFLDSSENAGFFETNGDLLIGNGAYISQPVITRDVDMLKGSFRLKNPFNGLISREIPHDASSDAVKDAIQEDLAISVLSVQAENMDPDNTIAELGRRWTIIFSHHVAEYGRDTNVPQLQAISDGLRGKDCHVWTDTEFEGRGILSGSFAVSFRGSGSSYFVTHDSSEEEVKAALESLESINKVSVTKQMASSGDVGKLGSSWVITFDSVNKLTDYGWLNDPGGASSRGNLPPLEVTSHLIGWYADILIQSETGRGKEDTQAQWMMQNKGDDGYGSGSVDVFRRVRETWRKEATVLASDFDSYDAFGASVSIADDYLLIGAPSKEFSGLQEQQLMSCFGPATDGFFTLAFRGFKSSSIPHDATLIDIQNSVVGFYGGTNNIHSTPQLLLESGSEGWDGLSSGFCEGSEKAIIITFLTPDGGGISTAEQRSGDIETLSVDGSNLNGAFLSVVEHRQGTVAPMGIDINHKHPTGKQSGSAYLFQRHQSCSYCAPGWKQIMKFTPMSGFDHPTDSADFGRSSKFVPGADSTRNLAMIGSPGFFHDSGKVYIFKVVQGTWQLLDSVTDRNWNHDGIRGGRFGSSLDGDSDTILIGSPGYSNGKGAVYVFRRSEKGEQPFLASQVIYGPDDLNDGDQFGHSLSLSNNKAVICAPHKTTVAVHVNILLSRTEQVGACYVYSREDKFSAFTIDQQLVPSNIVSGDRFGWSVAISSNRILVGQVEDSDGEIEPPRPVQIIKTFCEFKPCKNAAASKFRLQFNDIPRRTPLLSASTSANQMREVIESNLISGVSVSRSVLSDKDGGHTWRVTFDSSDSVLRNANKIPPIQCAVFVTSSLSCKTTIEHDIPGEIRGKVHLFDFDESDSTWTEQAFLFSSAPQKQDLLATDVAIDGNIAVAGVPNRELLNINSGAALIYDVSFLNLNFRDSSYTLNEGDEVDVHVERASSDERQVVSLRTMDSNAEEEFQHYLSDVFSLRTLGITGRTPVELLTGNTASRVEQPSLFIRGMYDIQGKNDYESINFTGQLQQGENIISVKFRATDDDILELPNERVSVQVNLRGMFASQLGRLKTDIHLLDNGDGVSPEGHTHYQVLDGNNFEKLARMGAAIDIDRTAGMLIVGSDQSSSSDGKGDQFKSVGCVHLYKRSSSGHWNFLQTLSPPPEETQPNMFFGTSVAMNKPYGRDDVTVLVGAPGAAAAFAFSLNVVTSSWSLQAKFTASDATLASEDWFGGRGRLALHEDMAFVGSLTMEQVYVFRRSFVSGQGFVNWDAYSILRSRDFDYDVYGQGFSAKHMHRQSFGMALAASHRCLIVGAPYANYGNRGDVNQREHFRTDGIHNQGLGKGVVYSFYSQPHVQIVTLQSDEIITAGSFTLRLNNHQDIKDDISGYIMHNATPESFKTVLEEMETIGKVDIETNEKIGNLSYKKSWRITFLSNFADSLPTLIPSWRENGCDECKKFKVSVLSTLEPFVTVRTIHSHLPYTQDGEMQPRDVTSTDLFGASIALDGPQAMIGSMHSAGKTRTTWDFETGDLQGWSATGTAFQYQPTYGDNSKFRAVYDGTAASHTSGEPQSSCLEGRYYIGTFEKRSKDDNNYQAPNPKFSLGSTQGDGPTGTLTSDPFIIRGKIISFLISGGCNHKTTFVELLVDGFPSLRATGKCTERLERVHWDVEIFKRRAGQIRIVDNDSYKWGHINVDDINFSWDMGGTCLANNFGQCAEGGGALPKLSKSGSEKQHYTGREESPTSGAAYMFLYECKKMDFDDFSPSNSNCVWVEQERLVPSDKRAGNLFGGSLGVNHELGIAIVGSQNAPAYGFYQEPISVHPFTKSTIDLPISEDLEDLMKSGRTFTAIGSSLRLVDHLIHTGQIDADEASKYTEQAGAVYVFLREPVSGNITQEPSWRTNEIAKIAPPDVAARDHFGGGVALDGALAVIGATGRDGHAENGGGAFIYDMEWVRVKFSATEFVAIEGQRVVKIFLKRDLSHSSSKYSIAYSTSDLSAVGVDKSKFDSCMMMPALHRIGCGDYEQSSGVVTFNPDQEQIYFEVRITDDKCTESHMEYVQLNLHQLGGSPLRGENYRAQLRIDDDDTAGGELSINCND